MKNYLFVPGKINYVRGGRPNIECILCGIVNNDPRVESLVVYSDDLFTISVNLYPYNPGHLIIFPKRHIEQLDELTENEVYGLHKLQLLALSVLREVYQPQGFNLGYNLGEASGASVSHLHLHIVPRYKNELGFIDIIGGARIMVEDPKETQRKLKENFLKK
ncbi:MAG: HIT domain-containing protein [Nitrososphaerota archaeon]